MPELESESFIVTDPRTRKLLDALRDKRSSPAVVALFHLIRGRIANQVAKTKRSFATRESYDDLLDRAESIFIERLPGAVLDTLCQALDGLADASADAAVAELPKVKRKRRSRSPETAARSAF